MIPETSLVRAWVSHSPEASEKEGFSKSPVFTRPGAQTLILREKDLE